MSRSESDRPAGPLATAVDAASEFEARTIVVVLEDAGIRAFVFPLADLPIPDPFTGRARTVPVQVAAGDLERARTVLAENRRDAAQIDWDELGTDDPPPTPLGAGPLRALSRALVAVGWVAIGLFLLLVVAAVIAVVAG
jgi:hypothetical protein